MLVAGPELLIEDEAFEDQVHDTDVALDVGAGAEIAVGRASLIWKRSTRTGINARNRPGGRR